MPKTTLTICSKNYSSWSLRGWLLARFAGLEFEEVMVDPDDVDARAEVGVARGEITAPVAGRDRDHAIAARGNEAGSVR